MDQITREGRKAGSSLTWEASRVAVLYKDYCIVEQCRWKMSVSREGRGVTEILQRVGGRRDGCAIDLLSVHMHICGSC